MKILIEEKIRSTFGSNLVLGMVSKSPYFVLFYFRKQNPLTLNFSGFKNASSYQSQSVMYFDLTKLNFCQLSFYQFIYVYLNRDFSHKNKIGPKYFDEGFLSDMTSR